MKGADPLIDGYFHGPFPAAPVAPWPPGLIVLYELAAGQKFNPAAMAAYERIRAFLAFPGVEVTPILEQATLAEDPWADQRRKVEPEAARAPAPVIASRVGLLLDKPDPDDLGD